MTVASYPIDLPPLVGLLGTAGTDQVYEPPQETAFDDGPPRTRRRKLFVAVPRKMTLLLTRPQFVTFRHFVEHTLNAGARRFTAPVRLPDGTLGRRTCKIIGKVSEQDNGPFSRVSLQVLVYDW